MMKRHYTWLALLLALCLALSGCMDSPTSDGSETTLSEERTDSPAGNGDPQTPSANEGSEEPKEIKNLILIIGDGMGMEHIAAGQLARGKHYDFTDWIRCSVNTNSIDSNGRATVVTDSAAAATALATGTLTVNGYVGKDAEGRNLETILDVAKALGKKTGIVTTDTLYGATPAGFSAHSSSRNNTNEILLTQLESGVDLLCGTTDSACTALRTRITQSGYAYADTYAAADAVSTGKLYAQLNLLETGTAAVALKDATSMAIDFLDNEEGFVLVVEQARIDTEAHSNHFRNMVSKVESLNETVKVATAFAESRGDTAVVVTADHETGGLCVSKQEVLANSYVYNQKVGKIYYSFSSNDHTDADVGLFLYGTTFDFAELPFMSSSHLIKNCDVPLMLRRILAGQTT